MLASFEAVLTISPKALRLYSSAASRTRRHVKSISPAKIENHRKRQFMYDKNEEQMEIRQFRKEFDYEIKNFGDVYEEPSFSHIGKAYDKFVDDKQQLKYHIKKVRMTRKHFKDLQPREVSLLTWAEKENIRYLHETEPETWTPEAISQAYPISPAGVYKLLKSSLTMRRAIEVKNHDMNVAQRIQDYKSGKLEMTEELRERLKIRDLIPLKIGDLGINADQIIVSMKPKVLGEFARLVTPPQPEKSPDELSKDSSSVKVVMDGDYCEPNALCETMKPTMSNDELKRIFPTRKQMTFSEFESRMKNKGAESMSADMKYMLNLNNTNDLPKGAEVDGDIQLPYEGDVSFPSKIQRYKAPEGTGKVTVNVEGGEGFIYDSATGYQKPYESATPNIKQRIEIPDELYKPDATYKVGDCYYDEDGEFLYRVP